jgi:hypothetical protein
VRGRLDIALKTYASQIVQSVQLGTQATMNAEELLVHDGGQWQAAERFHASLVDGLRVFVPALELEGEVVRQVATFVVSAEQPEGVGIVNLERPQVQHALYAEVPTVDVVSQKEVSSLGRVTAHFEELHQIVVLAVDVAAHGDGGVHLEEVGFSAQDLGALSEDP